MRVMHYYLCALFVFYSEQVTGEELNSYIKFKLKIIDEIIHNLLEQLSKGNRIKITPEYEIIPKVVAKYKDCTEIKGTGVSKSGIYEIWPLNGTTQLNFNVYCDMETDGGGWTVFQRRGDFGHPQNYFLKNWTEYSRGFGNLDEDFWLGNEKLHALTNQGSYSLRIDMKDKEGNSRYAQYKQFKIGNEQELFQLHVSGYSGDAGDSLILHHNGRKFSTVDKDNDEASSSNCAAYYKGAWWYNSCYDSNLNGLYLNGPHKSYGDGVEWYKWKGLHYSLPFVEMKIRRNDK
ncbi:techylectin-5A-like [Centruroides vittatus]|uniref:techylectin-5A-like n=1 Tax=Centruroides vittatus TaxID=120091 RepID=UPI003510866D